MNTLQPFFIRETVIRSMRSFFEQQGFHEVIVPVLNTALPLEPTLYSFETQWNSRDGERTLYLTVSPESGIKKMLGKGIENAYSIGKCFRNLEGAGPRHNPEFLMLEWYRKDATYHDIMDDTEKLIRHIRNNVFALLGKKEGEPLVYKGHKVLIDTPWQRLSLDKLMKQYIGHDIAYLSDDNNIRIVATSKGYDVQTGTWEQLFDQLFLNEVEPHLPKKPFFLTDFPVRLSPLCTVHPSNPFLAERFECYLAGMEIGNGNNENTDAQKVEQRFKQEAKDRGIRGEHTHPYDREFLDALYAMSKNRYAGIGMGVDRVVMIMAGVENIDEIDPFCILQKDHL